MNSQVKLIARSALSLVATLAIGGGVTYALFTSNVVTISGNTTVSAGSANLAICNTSSNGSDTWKGDIQPQLDLSGLNPGSTDIEVTAGHELYLGNDDGSLQDSVLTDGCDSYEPGFILGNSTVEQKFMPHVTVNNCPNMADDLSLEFVLGGAPISGYKTLNAWQANTSFFNNPTLLAGEAKQLQIFAKLSQNFSLPGETCTFNIDFTGRQV